MIKTREKRSILVWLMLVLSIGAFAQVLMIVFGEILQAIFYTTRHEDILFSDFLFFAAQFQNFFLEKYLSLLLPLTFLIVEGIVYLLLFKALGKKESGNKIVILASIIYLIKVVLPIVLFFCREWMIPSDHREWTWFNEWMYYFLPANGIRIDGLSSKETWIWALVVEHIYVLAYTLLLVGVIWTVYSKSKGKYKSFGTILFIVGVLLVGSVIITPLICFMTQGGGGDPLEYFSGLGHEYLYDIYFRKDYYDIYFSKDYFRFAFGWFYSYDDKIPFIGYIWKGTAQLLVIIHIITIRVFIALLFVLACKALRKEVEEKEIIDYTLSIGKLIFLSIVTFGVYPCFRVSTITEFCNRDKKDVWQNPTKKAWLCFLVPFYQIFWCYNQAQRLDRLSEEIDLRVSTISVPCLILGIFIPIVSFAIMQERVNLLCYVAQNGNQSFYKSNTENIVQVKKEIAEIKAVASDEINVKALKQLKELLDSGIITQEEFEKKKKEILGL